MIEAYGGDKWARDSFARIAGGNEAGIAAFKSDDAWSVYESLNSKREYIEGSCADYKAAVDPEPADQEKEQKEGKKIECPTLVMWSLSRLGKMHGDVEGIWKGWVKEGVDFKAIGCGEDVGHYLPEEASQFVGKAVVEFVEKVSK